MTPLLSIVIACHNDSDELDQTIGSIILNSPEGLFEIVVVDDASTPSPIAAPALIDRWHCVRCVRNQHRIGCGPSRYVGACVARGEWLLFTDSHMRFTPGWFDVWQRECGMGSKTLYCGSCLGLDSNNMDVTKAKPYFAATWNFHGLDKGKPAQMQTFECIWATEQAGNAYEVPAVMGACYIINRSWFLELNALRHLRVWGGDEQELSLKTWLAGGRVVFMKNLRIGHKFKLGRLNKIAPWCPIYNKLFVMHTCLPPVLALRLERKMRRGGDFTLALRKLHEDWHLVESERSRFGCMVERDFLWYLDRFKLEFPRE